MSKPTDYYQILGVTPSADLAVIKAVYKALALKFHPDRNKDSPDAAAKRMSEINEAYSVLSEEKKRAEYDKSRRGSSEQDQFDDDEEFGNTFSDVSQQIEADWALAKKYYPDLDKILLKFNKISNSLVLPYKLYLLETKFFSDRNEIANGMIDAYLKTYFGKDERILDFAKYLLKKDQREAARELNKAVKLFGKGINASKVISIIKSEYKLEKPEDNGEFSNNSESAKSGNPYSNGQVSTDLIHKAVRVSAGLIVVGIIVIFVLAAFSMIG